MDPVDDAPELSDEELDIATASLVDTTTPPDNYANGLGSEE